MVKPLAAEAPGPNPAGGWAAQEISDPLDVPPLITLPDLTRSGEKLNEIKAHPSLPTSGSPVRGRASLASAKRAKPACVPGLVPQKARAPSATGSGALRLGVLTR
jgi:hypothetical protein